jgi:hypothetical protein
MHSPDISKYIPDPDSNERELWEQSEHPYGDDGQPTVAIVTCWTCGRRWNREVSSSRTLVPRVEPYPPQSS